MAPAPLTPDGRYILVRGRLWRAANPQLSPDERERLVRALMDGRRGVAAARRAGDGAAEAEAHASVDAAKRALGERGPVWWADGAPDLNRHMARTTPYAGWAASVEPWTPGGNQAAGPPVAPRSRRPLMDDTAHKEPSLADKVVGVVKRGIAEVVGSHELQQEGVAQEREGNPARAEAEARAAVEGDPVVAVTLPPERR